MDINIRNFVADSDVIRIGSNHAMHNMYSYRERICLGAHSECEANNGIAIGIRAKVKHNNAIVIGTDTISYSENSVTLNDNIFSEGKLMIGNNFCLIGNNCAEDALSCSICDDDIISGIQYNRDEEKNSSVSLCFNCIFDTVMENKAKEQWIKHIGYDPITKLMADVKKLQEEIGQLKLEIKK